MVGCYSENKKRLIIDKCNNMFESESNYNDWKNSEARQEKKNVLDNSIPLKFHKININL